MPIWEKCGRMGEGKYDQNTYYFFSKKTKCIDVIFETNCYDTPVED